MFFYDLIKKMRVVLQPVNKENASFLVVSSGRLVSYCLWPDGVCLE